MWNKRNHKKSFFQRLTLCVPLLFFTPIIALAQVTPLIFEREDIKITAPARRTNDQAAPEKTPAKPPHEPLSFNIEERPEDALRLEYIHTLNNLTDSTGVMIVFTAPSVVPLPAFKVPTAVDALFITNTGSIAQILPNVVLADLTQEVVAHAPVKAFLFLKAGTVAKLGIHPQDVVSGKRFTPAPPVLE